MRSVLVFVKRKIDADRLPRAISRTGVSATSLHSNRTQEERTAALEAFRTGECAVLVATDVAGRGIDIGGISHVINFDVPRCTDDYIHRAGRTARAGRNRRGHHVRRPGRGSRTGAHPGRARYTAPTLGRLSGRCGQLAWPTPTGAAESRANTIAVRPGVDPARNRSADTGSGGKARPGMVKRALCSQRKGSPSPKRSASD